MRLSARSRRSGRSGINKSNALRSPDSFCVEESGVDSCNGAWSFYNGSGIVDLSWKVERPRTEEGGSHHPSKRSSPSAFTTNIILILD